MLSNLSRGRRQITVFARRQMLASLVVMATILAFGSSARASLVFSYDFSGNTPGVGFLDPTEGAARQAALVTAGNLFSDLFGSHFSNMGVINFAVTSTFDMSLSTLASAGSDFVPAPGTFGGGGVIRNKLVNGVDLNGAAFDGSIDVNWGYEWELDPNTPAVAAGPGQTFDLYAALFHEFTHALGFGSEIFGNPATDRFGQGGESSGSPGSFAKWDEFLATAGGTPLVDSTTFEVNEAALNEARTNGGVFVGPNALAVYGGPVPLFPNPDQSHLDETTFSTPNSPVNFMMKPLRDYGPQEARTYSSLEVAILRDLGYTPLAAVPEPGSATLVLIGLAAAAALKMRRRMA